MKEEIKNFANEAIETINQTAAKSYGFRRHNADWLTTRAEMYGDHIRDLHGDTYTDEVLDAMLGSLFVYKFMRDMAQLISLSNWSEKETENPVTNEDIWAKTYNHHKDDLATITSMALQYCFYEPWEAIVDCLKPSAEDKEVFKLIVQMLHDDDLLEDEEEFA